MKTLLNAFLIVIAFSFTTIVNANVQPVINHQTPIISQIDLGGGWIGQVERTVIINSNMQAIVRVNILQNGETKASFKFNAPETFHFNAPESWKGNYTVIAYTETEEWSFIAKF